MTEENFAWFAGIDWGSERHQACLVDAQGRIVGEREFPHGGKGLADLCDWLLSMCGAADTVAVGIEVPHGPVVDTLIDRGFVVHAINPKQLDRLRDRHSVAGAKDDRRDAYVVGDGVRTDRRLFRRVHVTDPRLVELRAWSRLAEELTEERVRLSNRVHHELWRYYPQMLKIADGDVAATWVLDLWDLAPTPARAHRLRVAPVEKLLKYHTSAASTPTLCFATCKSLPSKLARAWPRQPAFICVRCLPGCVSSTANCGRPTPSLMRCARRSARPMLTRERAFNDRTS
jgi:Transposase